MHEDTFKYRVAQVLSGDYWESDTVPVCATPQLIRDIGFSDGEIVITQKHIRNCLAPEETETKDERHHDLPIDFMDNLPQYIENPAMILSSLSEPNERVVLVTDCKDKKDRPIIIALHNNGVGRTGGRITPCNILVSTYGRKGFVDFLKRSIETESSNNGLIYWDEKKSRNLVVSAGLQLPRVLASYNSNVIIRRYNENVNPFSQKKLDFSPDGYGTTLNRPDGKPFAYSDPDGRQKIYEYTKNQLGDVVLYSTTATFSDGRSEITEYDDLGNIAGIERRDANGRTTYKYSSTRAGFYTYEKNVEYNEFNSHKSIHEKEHNAHGYYEEKYNEKWTEKDVRGRQTLYKENVYREDGFTADKYYCYENQCEHDKYGNITAQVTKRHGSTTASISTYYSSDKWYDYNNLTPQDVDGEYQTPEKSYINCTADGRISIEEYKLNGERIRREYSPNGELTYFDDVNGTRYTGKAAQRAYLKSDFCNAPSFKEIAEATKSLRQSALFGNGNKNAKEKGAASGKGNGGAGR